MSQNITAEKMWNDRDGDHCRVMIGNRMIAMCRGEQMDQNAAMIVCALDACLGYEPPACDVCGSIMVASRVCQCLNCGSKV